MAVSGMAEIARARGLWQGGRQSRIRMEREGNVSAGGTASILQLRPAKAAGPCKELVIRKFGLEGRSTPSEAVGEN